MLSLFLSVICSVTVGVLFKIFRKYNANNFQIVAINYFFALIMCYFFFSINTNAINKDSPWTLYIAMGLLLPLVFLFLVASIKYMGIVKTDVAQRLSLFIPILAAWFVFQEQFNSLKIIAFLIALPAIVLILYKPSKKIQTKNKWIYPAVVFFGFGIIDIFFKQIALYTAVPFTSSLFVIFSIALILMLVVVVYDIKVNKTKLYFKNIFFGFLVGVFNFGNIYFYLKAHQVFAANPSTVFAGMNMGVIGIGTLVGLFFFKEKLTTINFMGLFLALIAIVLIVFSQFK